MQHTVGLAMRTSLARNSTHGVDARVAGGHRRHQQGDTKQSGGVRATGQVTMRTHECTQYCTGKGFFALNNDPVNTWTQSLQTTLPAGQYCDLYSGEPNGTGCTGKTITVRICHACIITAIR